MPRKRKTQKPMTAGLEAGASYGQVGENLTSQNPSAGGIPLPQDRAVPTPGSPAPAPTGAGPVAPSGGLPPQGVTGALPLEAAQNYTPDVTPLMAPGQGFGRPPQRLVSPDTKLRSADFLSRMASATGDPAIAAAARQLKASADATMNDSGMRFNG